MGLINQPRNQGKGKGQNLKRGGITNDGVLDNKNTYKGLYEVILYRKAQK